MVSELNDLDLRLTQKLHLHENEGGLKHLAAFVAHSGDSWFDLIALFLVWVFTGNPWHTLTALMAGAIVILALLVFGVKYLIGRKRPEGEWGAVYRNTDPHSFPSGHAARTAMLATISFALGPAWLGFALAAWCLMVSIARVSLRVHYLSDVLAGMVLGVLAGLLVKVLSPLVIASLSWGFIPFFQ